jgi:O-antigen ligase
MVWAILVIAVYFQLGIFLDTWQTFIYPEKRLWGEPYFPDWPNFLAFGLGLAAVISVSMLRLNMMGALCLLASVMTTSRMALVALVVLSVVWLRSVSKNHGNAAVLGIVLGLLIAIWIMLWDLAVALTGSLDTVAATGYFDRLFKLGDRSVIWMESAEIFAQNPLLGIGAIPLDESIGLSSSSIHNSYLEVTIRYGILGLVAWIFLFLPTAESLRNHKGLLSVFLFIAISAFFNNVLRHPHYLIMYGVLLALGSTITSGTRATAIRSGDRLRHQEQ